jgi:putative ABC transport system permease protein
VRKLFELVGTADQVLRWVSLMVVVVALLGVMVAIYNTMGARRREFAILRALGARRRTLLGLVMAESALLALLGGIVGLGLSGILVMVAGDQVKEVTGVAVAALPGLPELLLLGAVTLAGALAGLVPAISAYRTETAHALAAQT